MRDLIGPCLIAFLIVGCHSISPPQSYSGISKLSVDFDDTGNVQSISSIDGKEFEAIELTLKNRDGSEITLIESEVRAFTGQEIQEGLFDLGFPDVSPELIAAILQIVNRKQVREPVVINVPDRETRRERRSERPYTTAPLVDEPPYTVEPIPKDGSGYLAPESPRIMAPDGYPLTQLPSPQEAPELYAK